MVYGWIHSSKDVAEYGMYPTAVGYRELLLDGYCGANVAVGIFISLQQVTRTLHRYPTGIRNGLGFSGQIIVWGYDLNASSYGNGQTGMMAIRCNQEHLCYHDGWLALCDYIR